MRRQPQMNDQLGLIIAFCKNFNNKNNLIISVGTYLIPYSDCVKIFLQSHFVANNKRRGYFGTPKIMI